MRQQLPNRRHSNTVRVEHKGQSFFLTFGMDEHFRVVEVFGNSSKLSSDMDFLVADACIVISIALQHGIFVHELKKSVKKQPNEVEGRPDRMASLIGVILEALEAEQTFVNGILTIADEAPSGLDVK